MAIKIQLINCAQDPTIQTPEESAVTMLKERFEKELSLYPDAKGEIYILTQVTIFNQNQNDIRNIDILVMGFLDGLIMKDVKTKNYGIVKELSIKSFITNIELKFHPSNKVKLDGADYIVTYGNNVEKNATLQCEKAKYSLINHLADQLKLNPFVCDIIWFNSLTHADLYKMRGSSYDNALHQGFSFKEYINAILLQANVTKDDSQQYFLDSFNNGKKEIEKILSCLQQKGNS